MVQSYQITQHVDPEDRKYLEVDAPQAKDVSDTSDGIFTIHSAKAIDTNDDG